MREILFRGKTINSEEWAEGNYLYDEFSGISAIVPYINLAGGDVTDFSEHSAAAVITDTVGQYTGLTDKNGKKIFEGDYIVCSQSIESNHIDKYIEMGYVEMKHGAFGLHRKQGYYRPFKDWLEDYEYEVIGNIHDNPELLGGAE